MTAGFVILVLFVVQHGAQRIQPEQADKLEEFFEKVKPISESIRDVNITDAGKNFGCTNGSSMFYVFKSADDQEEKELYEQWSQWSPCRNCRKVRRKGCSSPKCRHSILYEERPCNTPRCRRKLKSKNKDTTQIMEVFCGGTLISPNWVLTAAHCLRKILYVRLNEYDISFEDGTEIEYLIREMYPHYNYDTRTVDNDIALLKLPKSVPLPFACLPNNASLPISRNCTIVGWGKRSPYDFLGSKYLREAQMPVVPKEVCKKSYRRYVITDNMFCAGYKNGGIDTCSGDSGGGFMCLPKGKRYGWTVQGITSFGEGCGKKGKYGIYTDVRKYLPWLKRKIKQS